MSGTSPRARHGAIALVAACVAGGAAAAEDTSKPRRVWAIGLPNGYVYMQHQSADLRVSAEDVARGEVTGVVRLVVATHTPGPYTLAFTVDRTAPVVSVTMVGSEQVSSFGPRGGLLVEPTPALGTHRVLLEYRMALNPGTAPGIYPWPIAIGARRALPGEATSTESPPQLLAVEP